MTSPADIRKRLLKVLAELEDVLDDIDANHADDPKLWTQFDMNRTTRDLRTAALLTKSVGEKVMQVGTWDKT